MQNQMTERLRAAFGRFRAQDLAGAERLCGEILKDDPRHPDALHLLGVVRLAGGNPGDAVSLIRQALEGRSRDATMLENLGVAHLALRNFTSAEALFQEALALGASHGPLYMRLGIALASQGKLPDAEVAMREAARRSPEIPDVHLNLGNTLAERGALDDAMAAYNRVLELQPGNPLANFNLGNLHRMGGRLDEAAAAYERVLAVEPGSADTLNNLGLVHEQRQRLDEAVACYRKALELQPNHVQAMNNLGSVLRTQGLVNEAVACFQKAIAEFPNHVDAHVNLGIVRTEQGRHVEAEALLGRVLRLDPSNFEAHCNLGTLLKLQGRLPDSIAHYRRALNVNPKRAVAHAGFGGANRLIGDLEGAIACYRMAIELDPENADVHLQLAETLKVQGQLEDALASYSRALALNPDHVSALGGMTHVRQHLCKWDGIETMWRRLREAVATGSGGQISPFSLLSIPTTPAEQLACAKAWAQRELLPFALARSGMAFSSLAPRSRQRLRIGYLSWGFHRHATAYLIAQLFELHNRDRFEVFAYAHGPDDKSAIRARLQEACDRFTDVSRESYLVTAKRIQDDGVDILVDLTGYTLGCRPQILALRPAPVQVNWLAYPGTMGTDSIDYLVADPFIIPDGSESFYTEKVVRLPDCYQINDRKRAMSDHVPSREDCGLPDGAFVYCCFNQAYKILPDVFASWMRILSATPGSVLWLLETNRWATENLRRAAAEQGIAAERIVFAPHRPVADHLARYRLADLALDTFPYTSHTTAADALWAGCPLVTRVGDTFASRVAGSVLVSAGLHDLVTDNARDFERLVIELATTPGRLNDLRRRVQEGRDTCPLFDTPRFVRNLENAYEMMFNSFLGRAS